MVFHFKPRQIPQPQWRPKHWPTESETVILAPLATRVDILSLLQFSDEPLGNIASEPLSAATREIDADNPRLIAAIDKIPQQTRGRATPQRLGVQKPLRG